MHPRTRMSGDCSALDCQTDRAKLSERTSALQPQINATKDTGKEASHRTQCSYRTTSYLDRAVDQGVCRAPEHDDHPFEAAVGVGLRNGGEQWRRSQKRKH